MRHMLWVGVLAACSGPPSPRSSTPAPAPLAPPATTPAITASPQRPNEPVVIESPGFAFADPDRRAKLAAAFPAIERAIDAEVKQSGLALGIVIDGELAYVKGFGVTAPGAAAPDADTVYRIGSITKSFTGLALLALRDEGVLRLDDPLAAWVPEAATLIYPSRDARPITLRQLANHTSGLPRMGTFEPENGPTEAIVGGSLASLALETAPGTRWNYSNLGFGLLGIALGRAASTSPEEVIATRVFRPLKMTSTAWEPSQLPAGKLAPLQEPKELSRLGAINGAGGIYSSVRDMARYIALQLAAYPPRSAEDTGPIRRASLREAHVTGVPSGFQHQSPVSSSSYGFGWGRQETCRLDDLVGHNGAIDSYRADIAFSPSRGVGVIALTNFGHVNTNQIVKLAFAELAKTNALVPRAPRPSPQLEATMTKLLAVYHQWDEAALQAILARPIDPREQSELATYREIHGACSGFELARVESHNVAAFKVRCERGGPFEMTLSTNTTGKIEGFWGRSRGAKPSRAFTKMASAIVALHARWDARTYRAYLAKAASEAQAKELVARFTARHGTCKLGEPIHEGFEWGYHLRCTKEDVDMYLAMMPDAPSQIAAIRMQGLPGAPAKCD